ncbi:hypothetical protein [Thalassotalea fusca]
MKKEKAYFFDDKQNVKRVIYLLYLICALLFAMDFIVHRHVSHPFDALPGFYPIYGFIGCVVLVIVAKWMRKIIMRSEHYYASKNKNSRQEHVDD